jgi:hypothetical protein
VLIDYREVGREGALVGTKACLIDEAEPAPALPLSVADALLGFVEYRSRLFP